MSKTWPVECHSPVLSSCLVDDPANQQVLHHGAVAVQEDHGPAQAAINIVQPYSTGGDEAALGPMIELGPPRLAVSKDGGAGHGHARKHDYPAAFGLTRGCKPQSQRGEPIGQRKVSIR